MQTQQNIEPVKTQKRGPPSRQEVYRRLKANIRELHQTMGGLPGPTEASHIWNDIWWEESHHSTAIEGNMLSPKQVRGLLLEGNALGNRQLSAYLEVDGYAKAANWVYRQAHTSPGASSTRPILTLNEVRSVHHLVMSPVWNYEPHPHATEEEKPGSFRQHEIMAFPAGMKPVSWPLIPAELDLWLQEVNRLRPDDEDLIEILAMLHCRFEQIHPFLDGNGRTGRLLLNLILVRFGYPPVIISKRDRIKYLQALRLADQGQPGPLGQILARALLDNLNRFILPAVAHPDQLISLPALAQDDLGLPALRAAAARGRLRAVRGTNGQWRSTQLWVDEYRQTRYHRN